MVADDDSSHPGQAQASLDGFCSGTADARSRKVGGIASSVGALADAEPLLALPAAPYPATVIVSRVAGANAAVAFRGNSYSVPPGLAGTEVQCRHRLGTATLEICSPAGVLLASHRLAPDGAGTLVRTADHRADLERVVLSAFTTDRPCERKDNHPPGGPARAEAARLLAGAGPRGDRRPRRLGRAGAGDAGERGRRSTSSCAATSPSCA